MYQGKTVQTLLSCGAGPEVL